MRYIYFLFTTFMIVNCSGEQMSHSITKTQIAMGENKPPKSFAFANLETMRDYIFETENFSFLLPRAKEKDYTDMGGWVGENIHDGRMIVIGLDKTAVYQVMLSSSITTYTQDERCLEKGIRKYDSQRTIPNKRVININTHTEYHGRGNYPCIVSESKIFNGNRTKKKKYYSCYKFNPSKTKSKSVTVSLTYNNTSSKQYTYQDLQNRAKRTLDSLYIKDGW